MIIQSLRSSFIALVTLSSLAACQSSSSPSSSSAPVATAATSQPDTAPAAGQRATALTRVADPSMVCMVNDQFMNKPQIPVEVAGKTYFGCCPMCKEKLEQQATARISKDPVTGEPVDKATAVMAQDADGRVQYFASEQTLSAYNARL
jgi:YHS domain-containing protein